MGVMDGKRGRNGVEVVREDFPFFNLVQVGPKDAAGKAVLLRAVKGVEFTSN